MIVKDDQGRSEDGDLVSLTPEFREHLEDKLYNERFEDPRDEEREEEEDGDGDD